MLRAATPCENADAIALGPPLRHYLLTSKAPFPESRIATIGHHKEEHGRHSTNPS